MANYDFDYSAMMTMEAEFTAMEKTLISSLKVIAKEIGADLKKNIIRYIPKEEGAPKWGIHAADEVDITTNTRNNKVSITAKGGEKTGSLWWLIDNGHVAVNGHFVPGANFTDKAYYATDVSTPVDKLLNEVASK